MDFFDDGPGFHPGYNTIRSPVARMQSGDKHRGEFSMPPI
jgi:hypothetical protein